MASTVRRRSAAMVCVAGFAALLALAGCGAASDDSQSGSAAGPAAEAPERQGGAAPADQEADRPAAAPADLRVEQRQIIYTGSMTVRVENVDASAVRAIAIVTGAGGFVGGDQRTSDDSTTEASLALRVPAQHFSRVVDELAALGDQQRRDISTEDVTEETLDLDARIATQQARVASGRRLLAEASSLSDLVMLESELAKREADLASLEAKKRRLADLTALSTITVLLLGPNAPDDDGEGSETGFLVGLKAGWTAFIASAGILLTVLGALLPWIIALGVPAVGLFWLVRRFGRRGRSVPAPTMGGAVAPPPPGAPD